MDKKTIIIIALCFVFCAVLAGYFYMSSSGGDEIKSTAQKIREIEEERGMRPGSLNIHIR